MRSQGAKGDPTVWTYPGQSAGARLVAAAARIFVRPVISVWARVPFAPWPYSLLELFAVLLRPVGGVRRTRVDLAHCVAERTSSETGGREDSAILYLHGGAFLVGGVKSHRRLVSRIVRNTGIPALAVAYRQLSDGASVSTSLSDCMEGLRALLASGVPIDRIVVVGDSAGGYLALNVALEARRSGLGLVGGIGAMSPIVDLDPATKLTGPGPELDRDALFPPRALTAIWASIQRAENEPDACVKLRDFIGLTSTELAALPPLLIQAGSDEILLPDAKALVVYSAAAGGDARLEIYPGQVHVFQAAADVIPEGKVAINRMSAHIAQVLDRSGSVAA
ncbi:alpha/beta hydrolase fold domain-containing protein [Gordonia sp. PDNC005]|uniref:alpha/beta hydrolase n=1 Tax=unclassified Gordonia (in: high G+C Gram-positive bacteria) TaxID=2657482 RepID=UPI0019636635|nr:alpha/beta hydrolase fold domain-containing protein [Gordonia sp. PDNC005]QRY63190.1 alpha/beta hydrolase fold domain-containing protein [Gordonia sp. PDNC005]